ncbi:MAG: hypothetical protein HYV60_04380 [Planctomycetia bacterium]|nr:hypothetical protein [Planctomycetia bacterium]
MEPTSPDNARIKLHGHVQNGTIAIDGNPTLPEGAAVTVLIPALAPPVASPLPATEIVCEPGKLPYVQGGIPGSVQLTNERIHKILEEEEIAVLKRQWNVPS